MEKEMDTASTRTAALGGRRDDGEHVDSTANAFKIPQFALASIDGRDRGPAEADFSEHPGDLEAMSPAEKARQLHRRIWMIVAAACLAWAVLIVIAYAILV